MYTILTAALLGLVLVSAGRAQPAHLERVDSAEAFVSIARASEGDHYAKFLIDRHENRIFYINTRIHEFHYDFARTIHPNLSLEIFNDLTYHSANRRFIAGTLGWHAGLGRYTFQFWDGDTIGASLLELTLARLRETFHTPELAFKPNSPEQETLARSLKDIDVLTSDELYGSVAFKVYNPGVSVGRLRILGPGEDPEEAAFDATEIVLLDVIPSDITPVAGIISTRFSTPLSHMNLRAYAWKIPNMVLRMALDEFRRLDGQVVYFQCSVAGYEVREATGAEIEEYRRSHQRPPTVRLQADLRYKDMPDLGTLGRKDADRIGSKAANLSELARVGGLSVPRGFAIPFHWYREFLEANELVAFIESVLSDDRLADDARLRKSRLAEVRERIRAGTVTATFREAFLAKVAREYPGEGLFVRSSTNSEDLPGFNGAGLYDSVPNVRGEEALLEAVKQVWASVFNLKAYQERHHYGIDHTTVQAAVLVVAAVNAKAAGVMITTDIYDANFPASFTINAKSGLGIKVVDGKSLPEQVIYEPYYDTIRIITRSEDHTELVIGPDGGVIERPVNPKDPVLRPEDVRALGQAGQIVRDVFYREGLQDIEWVVSEDPTGARRVWIVQSRPYLGGGTAQPPARVNPGAGFAPAPGRRPAGPIRIGPPIRSGVRSP